MSKFSCAVCGKGPADNVSVYRMNATGQPGIWACDEHRNQFDTKVEQETLDIVKTLEALGDKR